MNSTSNWVIGGFVALLGLLALAFASRASDGIAYWTGLGLFVFCVLFCFGLVASNAGKKD